ncbi:hypothetical protein B0H17DRAFT_133683 [Mycena rosella]|uniref:Uncharacterized protein n=1 Tax=Mycena rosella TaxID=1033263 RepID=A0AAD7D3R4_MYCRO|nr:hypothetical protein B0H17DRAFT_133683 [Mycena rosella]
MLTAMARSFSWSKNLAAAAAVDEYADYVDAKPLPLTPGVMHVPTIAQLALPSPDDSSSPSGSSNASHEPFDRDVASPRRPNRLRKTPPSSYPFSFVPENPSPMANFPYAFHRSTPTSPATSFVAQPPRAMSVHAPPPPSKPRKLIKRHLSSLDPPPTAAADLSMARIAELPPVPPMPPLKRRSTFNFSLRRKKTASGSTQSEDGHGPRALPALPPPSPLVLNMPIFRPFHARRRDSWHVQPASEPSSIGVRHSGPPTADFDEVAWTGVAPKGFDTVMRDNRGGWKSTWSLTLPTPEEPPPPPRARSKPKFTLAKTSTRAPGVRAL